ncbi:MAG: TetR family transcriptional regulator C-terminal domain-containing protein [Owenweeksia sp.]
MDSNTVSPDVSSKMDIKDKIIKAYKEHILIHGTEPPSIFAFCKELGITEDVFYEHFNTFEQVAASFWKELFHNVAEEVKAEEGYTAYEAKEKLLTFFYAFFEALKPHRSFALLSFKDSVSLLKRDSQHLSEMKKDFKLWAAELINEGIRKGEIAQRLRVTNAYDNILWLQFMFLLNFWRKDGSHDFERTDAAIEKSVRFGFDLMEKNALDSAFDFGKFLFQDR